MVEVDKKDIVRIEAKIDLLFRILLNKGKEDSLYDDSARFTGVKDENLLQYIGEITPLFHLAPKTRQVEEPDTRKWDQLKQELENLRRKHAGGDYVKNEEESMIKKMEILFDQLCEWNEKHRQYKEELARARLEASLDLFAQFREKVGAEPIDNASLVGNLIEAIQRGRGRGEEGGWRPTERSNWLGGLGAELKGLDPSWGGERFRFPESRTEQLERSRERELEKARGKLGHLSKEAWAKKLENNAKTEKQVRQMRPRNQFYEEEEEEERRTREEEKKKELETARAIAEAREKGEY